MKSAGNAKLWTDLQRHQKLLTLQDQRDLKARLAVLEPERVAMALDGYRGFSFVLARAKTASDRKKTLDEFNVPDRVFAIYATTAWILRCFVISKMIDELDNQLPDKWAADSITRLVERYEEDDFWLWPYEGERPWPDDADDIYG